MTKTDAHAPYLTGKENRMSQSKFQCVQCGHTANADVHAAQNSLARALPSGVNDSGVTHVVA